MVDANPDDRRGVVPMTRPASGTVRCLDCAAVLHLDEATGALADRWGQAMCGASYLAHSPDLPALPAGAGGRGGRGPPRRPTRRAGLAAGEGHDGPPTAG